MIQVVYVSKADLFFVLLSKKLATSVVVVGPDMIVYVSKAIYFLFLLEWN